MHKVAVTGALGQLGSELCRQLGAAAVPLDLPEFDITDPAAVRRFMAAETPAAVVNCAAYTAVDRAEAEPDRCHGVNATAVAYWAEACRAGDVPLVQISTDYVFDGDREPPTPYREDDPPRPLSVYGAGKLAGERAAARWEKHLIVRTCGLYGHGARAGNFVDTMLRLGAERDRLRIVADQRCTPTSVCDLARAILFLLDSGHYGTYHVVNGGSATWYEFAAEIFRIAEMPVELEPITTQQYGAAAPRPRYSVLDTGKYRTLGGPPLPPWPDALRAYLAQATRIPQPTTNHAYR